MEDNREEVFEIEEQEAEEASKNLEELVAGVGKSAEEGEQPAPEEKKEEKEEGKPPEQEIAELNEKYLRLYADFENYRKRVAKDKEELVKYANESLLYELLPSLDNLEIALKHADKETSKGLIEGVEITLRELYRTLEKFGLKPIEALGKPFDPEFHHAMSQVERDDVEEKTVVEEFRKGYMYRDKVLRASLVAVSQKPQEKKEETEAQETEEIEINNSNAKEE